jgi:hypothetical protein
MGSSFLLPAGRRHRSSGLISPERARFRYSAIPQLIGTGQSPTIGVLYEDATSGPDPG